MIVTKGKIKVILHHRSNTSSLEIEPFRKLREIKRRIANQYPELGNYRLFWLQQDITALEELALFEIFRNKGIAHIEIVEDAEDNFIYLPKVNTEIKRKTLCNCGNDNILYLCRGCNEFMCKYCKDSSKHFLHQVIKLDLDNINFGLKYYASAMETDINTGIKKFKELTDEGIDGLDVDTRRENIMKKLELLFKSCNYMLDKMPQVISYVNFVNKGNGVKMNNNEMIENLNTGGDFSGQFLYSQMSQGEKEIFEMNRNIYLVNFTKEINNKLNEIFVTLEKAVDEALTTHSMLKFNFENNFDSEGGLLIRDPGTLGTFPLGSPKISSSLFKIDNYSMGLRKGNKLSHSLDRTGRTMSKLENYLNMKNRILSTRTGIPGLSQSQRYGLSYDGNKKGSKLDDKFNTESNLDSKIFEKILSTDNCKTMRNKNDIVNNFNINMFNSVEFRNNTESTLGNISGNKKMKGKNRSTDDRDIAVKPIPNVKEISKFSIANDEYRDNNPKPLKENSVEIITNKKRMKSARPESSKQEEYKANSGSGLVIDKRDNELSEKEKPKEVDACGKSEKTVKDMLDPQIGKHRGTSGLNAGEVQSGQEKPITVVKHEHKAIHGSVRNEPKDNEMFTESDVQSEKNIQVVMKVDKPIQIRDKNINNTHEPNVANSINKPSKAKEYSNKPMLILDTKEDGSREQLDNKIHTDHLSPQNIDSPNSSDRKYTATRSIKMLSEMVITEESKESEYLNTTENVEVKRNSLTSEKKIIIPPQISSSDDDNPTDLNTVQKRIVAANNQIKTNIILNKMKIARNLENLRRGSILTHMEGDIGVKEPINFEELKAKKVNDNADYLNIKYDNKSDDEKKSRSHSKNSVKDESYYRNPDLGVIVETSEHGSPVLTRSYDPTVTGEFKVDLLKMDKFAFDLESDEGGLSSIKDPLREVAEAEQIERKNKKVFTFSSKNMTSLDTGGIKLGEPMPVSMSSFEKRQSQEEIVNRLKGNTVMKSSLEDSVENVSPTKRRKSSVKNKKGVAKSINPEKRYTNEDEGDEKEYISPISNPVGDDHIMRARKSYKDEDFQLGKLNVRASTRGSAITFQGNVNKIVINGERHSHELLGVNSDYKIEPKDDYELPKEIEENKVVKEKRRSRNIDVTNVVINSADTRERKNLETLTTNQHQSNKSSPSNKYEFMSTNQAVAGSYQVSPVKREEEKAKEVARIKLALEIEKEVEIERQKDIERLKFELQQFKPNGKTVSFQLGGANEDFAGVESDVPYKPVPLMEIKERTPNSPSRNVGKTILKIPTDTSSVLKAKMSDDVDRVITSSFDYTKAKPNFRKVESMDRSQASYRIIVEAPETRENRIHSEYITSGNLSPYKEVISRQDVEVNNLRLDIKQGDIYKHSDSVNSTTKRPLIPKDMYSPIKAGDDFYERNYGKKTSQKSIIPYSESAYGEDNSAYHSDNNNIIERIRRNPYRRMISDADSVITKLSSKATDFYNINSKRKKLSTSVLKNIV
jgi:hypothetical protein